jgi:hypothetical protein
MQKMIAESASLSRADPLRAVAEALDAAVEAVRGGADDARARVANVIPAAGRCVSRFVYGTSYSISYGVVFTAVLIARAIPKNNAAVHGLIDGAHAAIEKVDRMLTNSPKALE